MSVATPQAISSGTWAIDKVHSHVGFAVKHMVVATFRGAFDRYDGALRAGEDGALHLEGSVDVDSIVVKDENLAGHLASPDFFDSAVYPRISFVADDVRVDGGGELEVRGELTIKGNTNPVSARGSYVGPHEDIAGNTKIGLSFETVIDRTLYGLNWNAPLPKGGFALSNEVTLVVELELAKA